MQDRILEQRAQVEYHFFLSFLISILLISCAPLKTVKMSRRDNIYLKSGEEFAGKLMEWKGDTIIFWTEDSILRLPASQISSVDFTRKRSGDWWVTKDDIDDQILKNILNLKQEEWYKNGGYVTLLRKREFTLSQDNKIKEEERVINKVLKERGKSIANQKFTYLSSIEKGSLLFARGITKEGNVVSIRENAIEDAPYFRTFLLYDDLRQKKFAIPESRIGSILDYSYRILMQREVIRPFYASINLGGWEPTKLDSVVLNIPTRKKILYKTIGLHKPDIKRTKKSTRYIWVLKNIKGKKRENLAPPFKDIFPRLTFSETITWKTVDSIFSSSLEDSLIYSDEILERLKKFKSLKNTTLIDSLYNIVCKEIRFAPVPINTTMPIPKSLKTLYKIKYANSFDKTYFLYGLLKKNGIKSNIVLARSKQLGNLVKEVPSPMQFSYAILFVNLGNDTLFLDPREDTYTLGYISNDIQGEDGLVLGTDGRFVKIPLLDCEKRNIEMNVRINPDGSCEIEKKEELGGKFGINIRRLNELKEEERRKRIEEEVASVYPGAELIDYSTSPLSDLTKEVTITLRYRIKDFALLSGKFLFVMLPEINYSASSVGATERELPLFFNAYETINHKINFFIPKGYIVYHIGKKRKYKSNFVTFSSEFLLEENNVVYNDHFNRNGLLIEPTNYAQYRTCFQIMAEVSQEILVLKKK